ncbi:MAG: DoxX family protein, partial [Muribaculaceae bacterium]|nr:DoxX family protein [Muribaculaceae bacterium]
MDENTLKEVDKKIDGGRKTPLGIEKRFDRFGDWLDDSWALRKANPLLEKYPKALLALTWLMRIAVGSVFIVSGLSKGIDPWGTFYKTSEYLTAMHIPIVEWGNTVLALAFMLFSLEFIIGVSLLTGCYRKAAPIMAALFMLVMLPLTLWIAIADPVADCGCFGDFLIISNWATFIKNCVISLAVVWLLKFNTKARCLIVPYAQWVATVGMAAYIVAVGYIGYWQ